MGNKCSFVIFRHKSHQMFRNIALLLSVICLHLSLFAQLQSPDAFLGYPVGSRYSPHWKIAGYFNQVAANAPASVKLVNYGETGEGRPLLLAFVSSPENISNLESIRRNNLRLANLSRDKMAAVEDRAPAIVWLSYNVHGDETSSSEAAMMTLWALVDPSNTATKEWLKNTVVVIDPCINPDGRDRYVNWFNSVMGKNANPLSSAREHRQPWPGGRTNHYNFDLNRDWAWQTQTESQRRMNLYNQWLPQVHVDYHEQGIDENYYFAPAAEPFHDVITPWQREFQATIGKNHAKYFDAKGWLYFTKEYFDLFYPSYGDTWPVFNGAIGMTYEQAGGGNAGSAVATGSGDTLTLYDRALHHYTTSISTVEIASLNAARLIREFHKYFNDAVTAGVGEYKTFVLKYDTRSREKMESLRLLLDRNGIQYGAGSGAARGYNYNSGKEENFTIGEKDIVISSFQPKSALAKVLLEPKSRLTDSITYDITAWSIPYAYGLDAYACRDRINSTGPLPAAAGITNPATSYGYVIPWNGLKTVKAIGQLLQKGILLRYTEQPFEVNGRKFDRGSILVLKTANKSFDANLWNITRAVADANGIELFPVSTGYVDKGYDFGSGKVHTLKAPKVLLMTGESVNAQAAGEIWHFFEQQIDYPITLVNAADFGRIRLEDADVIIMPDGNYRFLTDKTQADAFKAWINKGGRVVALEGAAAGLARAEFGIKIKKADDSGKIDDAYDALKKFDERERDFIPGTIPGSIYKVELDNSHPLAYGYPGYYYTLKMDDNIFEFIHENGWNVGVIKKDNQVAGFVGARLKEKLKDGLLFGVQQLGGGSICYLADDVLFRSFWENGKLMLCNAVFLVGQ